MKTLMSYKLGEKIKEKFSEFAKAEGKSASAKIRELMRSYLSGKNGVKIKDMEFKLFILKNKFGTLRENKVVSPYSFPDIKLPKKFEKAAKQKKISSAVLLELVIANYLYDKVKGKEEQSGREWTKDFE